MNAQETVDRFLNLFPEYKSAYNVHMNDYGELLQHVFYSEVINDPLSALLKNNKETDQIKKYVGFVEDMSFQGDESVQNVVDVTILECLSDDVDVWNNLGKYISDEFRNYINNELLKQNCAMWHVKMI